jgi:hypothetical protein
MTFTFNTACFNTLPFNGSIVATSPTGGPSITPDPRQGAWTLNATVPDPTQATWTYFQG